MNIFLSKKMSIKNANSVYMMRFCLAQHIAVKTSLSDSLWFALCNLDVFSHQIWY